MYELFPGLEEIVQQASPDNAPVEEKAAYWQHILDNVCGQGQTRVVLVEGNEAASTNAQEGTHYWAWTKAGYSSRQLVKTGFHESIGHMVRGLRAKQQEEASMRTPQAGNLAWRRFCHWARTNYYWRNQELLVSSIIFNWTAAGHWSARANTRL